MVPIITPSRIGIRQGDSLKITCVSKGYPMPTISLYINNHLIRSSVSFRMITQIHDVGPDIKKISCHVFNGYGSASVSSIYINVKHKPIVKVFDMGSSNQEIRIGCGANAYPCPDIFFIRHQAKMKDSHGVRIDSHQDYFNSKGLSCPATELLFSKLTVSDAGRYYCRANNSIGQSSETFRLNISPDGHWQVEQNDEISGENNLSSWSLFEDFDYFIGKPKSLKHLNKLIKCASGGNDFRTCCGELGVSDNCMQLCSGDGLSVDLMEEVDDDAMDKCITNYSTSVLKCFSRNSSSLLPTNISIQSLSSTAAFVSWQPSTNKKIPDYCSNTVIWNCTNFKLVNTTFNYGQGMAFTSNTSLLIRNLVPFVHYNLYIKMGNGKTTTPVSFLLSDKDFIEFPSDNYQISDWTRLTGIGLVMFIALLIFGLCLFILLYEKFIPKFIPYWMNLRSTKDVISKLKTKTKIVVTLNKLKTSKNDDVTENSHSFENPRFSNKKDDDFVVVGMNTIENDITKHNREELSKTNFE